MSREKKSAIGAIRRTLDRELISVFVPKEDLTYLDMTIEEGMKLVVSAGLVSPPDRAAPDYTPSEAEEPAWRRRQAQMLRAVRDK